MSAAIETRVIRRHCTERGCGKCRARSHWLRSKAWRSRKSPRSVNGRKPR
jgi:hypothetical protein